MSYRQSSYEPNRWEPQGPPARPYNGVQWTGVAIAVFGAAGCVYYLLGKAGLVPKLLDDATPFAVLPIIGATLVSSRRQSISPEQAARQRRRALIVAAVALAAVIVGLAIIFLVKGAAQ